MSLVAKVEQLIAEEGDGLLKAVKAVASHVEQSAGGAAQAVDPAAAEVKLKGWFDERAEAFFAAAKAQVDGKLAELEGEVSAALAKLHGAPAQPATPGGVGDPNVQQSQVNEQAPQPAA